MLTSTGTLASGGIRCIVSCTVKKNADGQGYFPFLLRRLSTLFRF